MINNNKFHPKSIIYNNNLSIRHYIFIKKSILAIVMLLNVVIFLVKIQHSTSIKCIRILKTNI